VTANPGGTGISALSNSPRFAFLPPTREPFSFRKSSNGMVSFNSAPSFQFKYFLVNKDARTAYPIKNPPVLEEKSVLESIYPSSGV
jgi:hypothetical protein